jgi:hypothetical protein
MEFNNVYIPVEIICRIVDHLTVREIVGLIKTNKFLNNILRDCTPIHLDFSDIRILPSQLLNITKQFEDIVSLTTHGISTEGLAQQSGKIFMLDDFFRVAPNLKHLQIGKSKNSGKPMVSYTNFPVPASLETFILDTSDCGQLGKLLFPNSLTVLDMPSYHTPSAEWKHFPKSITSLKIATRKYETSSDGLDLHNLIDFQIEFDTCTAACQLVLFKNLPSTLKSFRIIKLPTITRDCIKLLPRQLTLFGMTCGLPERYVQHLPRSLTTLSSTVISHPSSVGDDQFPPNLKRIHLDGYPQTQKLLPTSVTKLCLIRCAPTLTHLIHLISLDYVSGDASDLPTIFTNLPRQLRSFKFSSISGATARVLVDSGTIDRLPKALETLILCNVILRPQAIVNLPNSLIKLHLDHASGLLNVDHIEKLPRSLTHLCICSDRTSKWQTIRHLPPQLNFLDLSQTCYFVDLPHQFLPSTLTHLNIAVKHLDRSMVENLPLTLKSLNLKVIAPVALSAVLQIPYMPELEFSGDIIDLHAKCNQFIKKQNTKDWHRLRASVRVHQACQLCSACTFTINH